MRLSTRLRLVALAGVIAALLIGASLTASPADARGFDGSDETVAEAKVGAADDDRPASEQRGGKKPKPQKLGKGPPSWALAYGFRARSTIDLDTPARSDGRDDDDGDRRDDRGGRSDISNTSSTTVSDAEFIWPVNGRRLTTRFSSRHAGIDVGVSYVAVFAAAGGEVVFVGGNSRSGYGRYVEIRHAGGYLTRYAHLSRTSVRVGDRVEQGEVIGRSGNTGYTTGPHLHFELHLDGAPVDPLRYLP